MLCGLTWEKDGYAFQCYNVKRHAYGTMEQLSKEPNFEKPYYWRPLLLVGDGF